MDKRLKVILTFLGVILLLVVFYFLGKSFYSDSKGELTIILENEQAEVVSVKDVYFEEGETLLQILSNNFDVEVEEYPFGSMILKIESLDSKDNHFIAIFLNGKEPSTGIDGIEFQNGDEIRFVRTAYDPLFGS